MSGKILPPPMKWTDGIGRINSYESSEMFTGKVRGLEPQNLKAPYTSLQFNKQKVPHFPSREQISIRNSMPALKCSLLTTPPDLAHPSPGSSLVSVVLVLHQRIFPTQQTITENHNHSKCRAVEFSLNRYIYKTFLPLRLWEYGRRCRKIATPEDQNLL